MLSPLERPGRFDGEKPLIEGDAFDELRESDKGSSALGVRDNPLPQGKNGLVEDEGDFTFLGAFVVAKVQEDFVVLSKETANVRVFFNIDVAGKEKRQGRFLQRVALDGVRELRFDNIDPSSVCDDREGPPGEILKTDAPGTLQVEDSVASMAACIDLGKLPLQMDEFIEVIVDLSDDLRAFG